MFRLVQAGSSIPFSFPVDPTAEFQPGQIAQLKVSGNQIVCGVSDGLCPIGIIDDIKTNAFTQPSIDEVIIAPVTQTTTNAYGQLVNAYDIKMELDNPNVVASSFVSDVEVTLNTRNGVITFLAGTPLNFSQTDSGTPDAIRTRVNYTYQVPNVVGDDSTLASGRITVWFQRIIGQTDMYDTTCRYPVNATLYCNENGMFTTRRISEDYPGIAIVTAPPVAIRSSLEFMLL